MLPAPRLDGVDLVEREGFAQKRPEHAGEPFEPAAWVGEHPGREGVVVERPGQDAGECVDVGPARLADLVPPPRIRLHGR